MATTITGLTGTIRASFEVNSQKAGDLGTAKDPLSLSKVLSLTYGTGAIGKADQIFHDRRKLAASGTDDLDLAGALGTPGTNVFGDTITFGIIRAIIIINQSDLTVTHDGHTGPTAGVLGIGASGGNEWVGTDVSPFSALGDMTILHPGGFWLVTNPTLTGWAVGAGATDLLRIAEIGTAVTALYDIAIVGEEA